ncbi:FecCD family ABC transporter permease [Paeniglutamicibacter quisquiliarum]|uniref:FecCD family ABC transporter permease n=1 Tax=Paeniglutamicibacter quisquiliarum TaxID=2849498 RepID=UPI003AB9370D
MSTRPSFPRRPVAPPPSAAPATAAPPARDAGSAAADRRPGLMPAPLLGLVLAAAVAAMVFLSLLIGARPIAPATVLDALANLDPSNGDHAVVASRIPRTIAGLLIGAALGLAGAGMQGITRNPLADPGILGINAGAALAVVAGIHFFAVTTLHGYILFAFVGAAGAALLVYVVASLGRDGATGLKLALAGAAMAAGLGSLTNAILMIGQEALDRFRFWQVGTLGAREVPEMLAVAPFLALGAVAVLAGARLFNALALGDDSAVGLGFRVGRGRAVSAAGVVLLCGAATALAGPIGFVGLIVPHAIRVLAGGDYRWLLPLSMLAGPVLLLGADVVGRVIAPPAEIQVGVMTAVLGAPLFLWLLRRGRKVTL